MDKDEVKGKLKDAAGRVERQVGEWTGDKDLQAEGTKDQIKGKAQNMWGKVKDAARDAKDNIEDNDRDRDVKRDDVA